MSNTTTRKRIHKKYNKTRNKNLKDVKCSPNKSRKIHVIDKNIFILKNTGINIIKIKLNLITLLKFETSKTSLNMIVIKNLVGLKIRHYQKRQN